LSGISHAVFISHASQDGEAAARIVGALRGAGIEVWFDKSELRGGDAWDQRIRKELRDCALFMPIISARTESRHEGYFRLEWDIADQRTHMLSRNRAFIMPVCIDDTADTGADVPESFLRVQWTRLRGGDTPPEFIEQIRRLLTPAAPPVPTAVAPGSASPIPTRPAAPIWQRGRPSWLSWVVGGLVVTFFTVYLLTARPWTAHRSQAARSIAATEATAETTARAFEKSIAVLPFVNMSPDKEQEYFADGLAEELLDLLAKTPGLHVVARTSSFSFKGKSDDIPTIAGKLKVANILEGSVRKSGNRLRVTTQLVRAADGEQLWSETFDREMKDIFVVQDEIAAAVVSALKLKLAPGQNSSPRRSRNPDAYFQYLLGEQLFNHASAEDFRGSIAAYRQAIALDPNYAAAYAGLAMSEYYLADETGDAAGLDRAIAAAERAVALSPDQPMGYASRGDLRSVIAWDWAGAQSDFARALELDPSDPFVLRRYAQLLYSLGRLQESVTTARKVTEIDPFSAAAWRTLSEALYTNSELRAAREAARRSLAVDPANPQTINDLGTIELLDQRPAEALAAFQRIPSDDVSSLGFRATGIAMAEHSLGHARESQQALDEAIANAAQIVAYQIAYAYAWRGEKNKAFEWLERAYRQHDGGLTQLKTDPLLAALRSDPRFKAMLKKINLPE
jgi:TolB-like protein/Flp pilus assembly protein TadD